MSQIDNIKDEVAAHFQCEDFSSYLLFEGAMPFREEKAQQFIDRCITLALQHKQKAGINIEEAQKLAADEFPHMSIITKSQVDRGYEIYASSAVEAYRQRIGKALPTKSEVEKEINSRIWRISDYDQFPLFNFLRTTLYRGMAAR